MWKDFNKRAQALITVARSLGVGIKDLVLPPRCMICAEFLPDTNTLPLSLENRHPVELCETCLDGFSPLPKSICRVCGQPFKTSLPSIHTCAVCRRSPPRFNRALASGLFEGTLRRAVHMFKYEGHMALGRHLAAYMRQNLPGPFYPPDADIIMPVPLHKRRLRERGFNQALILCRELFGKQAGEKIRFNLLTRTRWTEPQINFKGKQRRDNVKNAFTVIKTNEVAGRSVLLVDDVFTTGATANECARVLKKAGVSTVNVLTLCRVS